MSLRLNMPSVAFVVATLALGAPVRTPPARAAVSFSGAAATVKESARVRGAGSSTRAATRVRLSLPVAAQTKPQTLSVTLGGFTVDVPLKNGRKVGRVFIGTGTVLVDVSTRRGRLTANLRARVKDGGSVLGETVVADAAAASIETGMAYDLEEGSVSIDGVPTPLALGLAARIEVSPGGDGAMRTRARVVGAALSPSAGPVVQVPRVRPEDPWTGRVAGHALATGAAPRLSASLSDDLPFLVEPFDGDVLEYGSTTSDAPGVRTLTIGSDTFYQSRFDFAVQSVPGLQSLTVGVPEGTGFAASESFEFTVPETAAPLAIAAEGHVLEIRQDQSLWAWGANESSQVGDGTTIDRAAPVQVPSPPAVRAVAASGHLSFALDLGGAVWRWGVWSVGQGNVLSVPTPIDGLASGIIGIAAGDDHLVALDFEGEVWTIGANAAGQLGDGTLVDHGKTPQHVKGVPPVVAVAAAGTISLALDEDGVVWAWGAQNLAGIGDGSVPLAVAGLPKIIAISAGTEHALALAEDGTVWAWGRNTSGQLGSGAPEDSDVPVLVSGLAGVASISAGASHSLAVLTDGTVSAWGANDSGQLGDGTSTGSGIPVPVRDLTGITLVAAGATASFAVDSTGATWVWGATRIARGTVGQGQGLYPVLAPRGVVEDIPESPPPLSLPR
jgi:alpha-tubulin suppressor-like RCC1 family protein